LELTLYALVSPGMSLKSYLNNHTQTLGHRARSLPWASTSKESS